MIHTTAKIHPQALIDSEVSIGANTRIWAFSHILSNVIIGDECNICDHTLIETGVKIGNRVTVKSGVYIWAGLEIEDDVFIGPCVAFTNDKYPRSKQYPEMFQTTRLKQGCSIGANATILSNIQIGKWAMIGAASVVTKDIPDYAIVYGNPAKIKGWICQCSKQFHSTTLHHCTCGKSYTFHSEKACVQQIENV